MESVPDLPARPELRAFVIWATAGLLAIAAGLGVAMTNKNWTEARRAALVCGTIILGMLIGQLAPGTHTWTIWAGVLLGIWTAHKNTGLSSFFVFIGTLGIAASSLLARSLF